MLRAGSGVYHRCAREPSTHAVISALANLRPAVHMEVSRAALGLRNSSTMSSRIYVDVRLFHTAVKSIFQVSVLGTSLSASGWLNQPDVLSLTDLEKGPSRLRPPKNENNNFDCVPYRLRYLLLHVDVYNQPYLRNN